MKIEEPILQFFNNDCPNICMNIYYESVKIVCETMSRQEVDWSGSFQQTGIKKDFQSF